MDKIHARRMEHKNIVLNSTIEELILFTEETSGMIDLENCQITDEDTMIMCKKFYNDCGVGILNLSHNLIGDEGVVGIVSFLDNIGLDKLDLSYNHITDKGAAYLLDIILHSKYTLNNLKYLNISHNNISPDMEQQLLNAIDIVKNKNINTYSRYY